MNLLVYWNLKKRFVYFQILHTRSYKNLGLSLETFLYTFGIDKIRIFCNSEGAFLNAEVLTGGSREKHEHNSLNSAEGRIMLETFDIRFICNRGCHSYLSGFVESKVKVTKIFFYI